GVWLDFFWNLPALLALQVAAQRFGWWTFDASGGLILGMPVDLYLAWAWLWALASLGLPSGRPIVVMCLAVLIDVVLMPLASPTIRLGPSWLFGEAVAVMVSLGPALLLARWTATDVHLTARA